MDGPSSMLKMIEKQPKMPVPLKVQEEIGEERLVSSGETVMSGFDKINFLGCTCAVKNCKSHGYAVVRQYSQMKKTIKLTNNMNKKDLLTIIHIVDLLRMTKRRR